jgi:hypothetical protein
MIVISRNFVLSKPLEVSLAVDIGDCDQAH